MRLKSLEMVGFKSFADPFRIDFRPGISAIVGPNGCGKSNIADAVRWVLGTQSPSQLRTEKMESVIFSGSSGRKSLGMAEVTLTFDNSDRSLRLDYDEVSVSRRLFRSGESEYSINGARCRLMDVTDLVVDRGLGSTGYWILESRMVGKILSNRPEDRRFLFDEAAGIVKYKIQRHRAELKLNSAASDLERLSDIISEVRSTCNGLKRQVAAYRKRMKTEETVRELQQALDSIDYAEIDSRLRELRKEMEETGALVGRETAALAARSAVLAQTRTEFSMVQGKLDEAHAACASLDSQLAGRDRESAVINEKIATCETRTGENRARLALELERTESYRDDISSLEAELASIDPEVTRLEKLLFDQKEEAAVIKADLVKSSETAASVAGEKAALEERIASLEAGVLEGVRKDEASRQKLAWIEQRLEDIAGRTSALNVEIEANRTTADRLSGEKESLESAGAETACKLSELREQLERTISEKSNLEREAAVAGSNIERLEALISGKEGIGSLFSGIEHREGKGAALGAFLHGFDTAVPANGHSLDEVTPGSVFALSPSHFEWELPPGAVTLDELVTDTGGNDLVLSILRKGVLAPDRATALEWMEQGLPFPAVTADGDLFRPEGLCRIGVSETSAGVLELGHMVQGQRDVLADLSSGLEESSSAILRIRSAIETTSEDLKQNGILKGEVERNLASSLSAKNSCERSLEALTGESAELEEERSLLEKELSASSRNDIEAELESARASARDADRLVKEADSQVRIMESALAEKTRDVEQTLFALREYAGRKKEITGRISLLDSERNRASDLAADLEKAIGKTASSMMEMKTRLEELEKESADLREERGTAEERRTSLAARRNELTESTALLERDVQQIRERLSRARSRLVELESSCASMEEKLRGMKPSGTEEDDILSGRSREELNRLIESAREALEGIGPVNMLAVREYEEASGRLKYLMEQKEDLENARASLSRAISEINEEAARRFRETFEMVRGHFREMFVKLFEGGEGDIHSIAGEDPLEGGIEIMARPKGKKLKSVIALSEGEKAMTAVALLFSLYLVKPSPFCILDELDAPFDDTNIDKFIDILREFSGDTQFIVITHNKRTMEGSDSLYGITMAEEGVSSVTSVSMEEMVKGS